MRGLRLYIPRDRLPAPEEDEFYLADLIGLAAVSSAGEALGRVKSVQNFGAGDLLEIEPPGGAATWWAPFTRQVVPEVRLAQGMIVVDRPAKSKTEPKRTKQATLLPTPEATDAARLASCGVATACHGHAVAGNRWGGGSELPLDFLHSTFGEHFQFTFRNVGAHQPDVISARAAPCASIRTPQPSASQPPSPARRTGPPIPWTRKAGSITRSETLRRRGRWRGSRLFHASSPECGAIRACRRSGGASPSRA